MDLTIIDAITRVCMFCSPIFFIWSLFNIDYLDKQLSKPIYELFKKDRSE